ncbi:MAG: S8 family serine peptidase [Bacteroidales bacterium]|nr:S8 family serine peptidase [Bacteroidales bacterium]
MRLTKRLLILSVLLFAVQASMAQYRIYGGHKTKRFSFNFDTTVLHRAIYAVKLTDKAESPYSVDNPQAFLSQKALDRRAKYKIPITEQDIPVNQAYIDKLTEMGFIVRGKSKWLNCVWVECPEEKLEELKSLSFVDYNYQWRQKTEKPTAKEVKMKRPKLPKEALDNTMTLKYGRSDNQTQMLNVQSLHNLGFTGKNVTVAFLDAGFTKADQMSVFEPMFNENRVLYLYDFVEDDQVVYDKGNHGMNVLSCVAANQPEKMIGTAPDVSVVLFRTEDEDTEYIIEEFNWMEAAEIADSLGVDMIHSSLGYHEFDDPSTSYAWNECNGDICISTMAADFAASKGIYVNVSAGNEGDEPWKHITAPADADSCMAIGAVDNKGKIAFFSSLGPSYDGRIKPDVCAKGYQTTVNGISGHPTSSSGTSFSGPIMAGCAACLMQAHPNAHPVDIMNAIRLAGSNYKVPDATYGYGIPDMGIAHQILVKMGL